MNHTAKQKLTILIAADTYPPDINGAARFGQNLAEGLSRLGHTVYVIAPRFTAGKSSTHSQKGVTEYRLRSHAVFTHPIFRICFPWEIKKEISVIFEQIKPDVIHVQCHYLVGRCAVNEARRRNIPIIATNHVVPENITPFFPFPDWLTKLLIKYSWYDMSRILNKANVVTAPTDLAVENLNNKIKLPEVLSISNGIDPSLYELKPDECIQKTGHPTVLFVGRLAQEKNIDVLMHAIAKIPAELNVHLEIVGDGEILPALQEQTKTLNIAHRVKFLGLLDEQALRIAYLRASIFCMPGTAELQSLATLEAMSASLPVVVANALALPHLVVPGKNGYLFTPGDSADLAEKIVKIISLSESLQAEMGQYGHKIAHQHHINKTLASFESLYQKHIS